MLRNYPVILFDKRIGMVQNVSMDLAQKRVCALMISCGLRGRRVVLRDHILSFADGFILTDGTEKYNPAYEEMGTLFVRDTSGLLLGRVSDYAVDEETLGISAVEMISGYMPLGLRRRIWIYDYAFRQNLRSEITVSAMLSCEPNCFMGGNG